MASETAIAGKNVPVYETLYKELNPQLLPTVDASTVAQFLKRSGLGVLQLSQIWELSDREKKGCLDKLGIFTAFKLIAGVQQGRPLSANILTDDTLDVPKFQPAGGMPLAPSRPQREEGMSRQVGNSTSPVSASPQGGAIGTGYRSQRSASVASKSSLTGDWEIDSQEQNKYETIFYSLKPTNGKLSGEQCRSVLLNSRLPQALLARIWELADVDRDGHLDKYEMCIALHLVYRCLHGEALPDRLPISLIHPMKRVQCSISASGSMGSSPAATRRSSTASVPVSSIPSLPRAPQGSRMSSDSIHSLTTPSAEYPANSIFNAKHAEASASWPVDIGSYAATFQKLDMDADGFVTGLDVKSYAMEFGIPQQSLAHIWALVDVGRSGRLNLEQFALWSDIMKEVRSGNPLPEYLPAHLVPPSMRAHSILSRVSSKGNSMSNISLGAESGSGTPVALPADNPRIVELNAEIEKAMENRRKAEQDLFQLEADTLVKNSELKNMELELQTLSTTVKQLQHQKTEAGKRLLDLDTKISKLEGACAENTDRLTSEEERLQRVKAEIAQAQDNSTAENEIIQKLQAESAAIDEKLALSKKAVADESAKMEQLVDELTKIERLNDAHITEFARVEKLTETLTAWLEKFEKKSPNEGETSDTVDEEILRANFEPIPSVLQLPGTNKVPPPLTDPFKDDPFGSTDDSAAKFADPFRDAAFAPTNHPSGDPFSSNAPNTSQSSNGAEFADFSKFATFAS